MGKGASTKNVQKYYYKGPVIDKKTHKIKYDRHGHVEMGNCLKDVEYYERLGLPAADAKTLARVMKQSMLYDGDPLYGRHQWPVSWIYGLGLTTVIGYLLPTAGDVIDTVLEVTLILNAMRGRPGRAIILRMSLNTAIDFGISLPPVLGAFIGRYFRSNTKNALLLEKALIKRAKKAALQTEKPQYPQNGNAINGHEQPPPKRVVGHESDMRLSESPHGSARRQYVQEQPAKSKTGGWMSRFGKSGSRNQSAYGEELAPQRPVRPENRSDSRSQGGRFISAGDL